MYTPESGAGEKFDLRTHNKIQNRLWTAQHDLKQEHVYLIDVKQNRATSCALAADGSIENIDVQKLTWQPKVEILEGQYKTPTIYLIEKNRLSQLAELNSIEFTTAVRFEDNNLDFLNISIPGPGMIVDPFHHLEIDPALVVDKTPSQLKAIHGFWAKSLAGTYTASKQQPNIWEINIPDLFPVTRESDSLSSVR